MRSSGADGVLHFPSPPLLPPRRMLPGSSKIVRSLALSRARYPRSSVMLPYIMVTMSSSEGPKTLDLLFGNALSQRLTSQRSCAKPSRSLGLPWKMISRSLWFRMISSVPKPCSVPWNGMALL
jgi:hypothetical protein